ncbi:MAG: cupin [Alphaproteobacteria bacterium]|nr:cupin [Alphaproteobacteria bacterium]|tara:strand:- start:276 stop:605 length:330 start_codon:yes stop_codon:yes gene_type:complete
MSTKLMEKTAVEAADREIGSFTTLVDDEKTRITHWVIKPGQQTGWHLHDYDYVTIQQSKGRLHLDYADGSTRDVDYVPGTSSSIKAPVEHNATNVSDVDIVVLEIEYKF